eukprot:CAMPEP_0116152968 /NCGR_PEP_ID=MMETSP0329-20121206/20970_1 /TAXON_ID=697910 /ORGANISM="Pseudo-nitzschia arenysensis, Strain B593" /LENGTH=273 /DNA_ID=CAMNT_0003649797 /DNA_START=173 /DNA_END=994 /DNA_ORIENTATION=+
MKDYMEMGTGIAMRLERGGHIEQLFGNDFAQECREQLKGLASDHVLQDRQLQAYLSAYKVVTDQASEQQQIISSQIDANKENEQFNSTTTTSTTNNNNTTSSSSSSANEYKEQMEVEYDKAMQEIQSKALKITQEPAYLAIVKNLGEDQEEDDDLEVVNPNNNSNCNTLKIKCPLTMALMEDPVRSKVCKHSFGRAAIYEYLRKGKQKCPVPGCINGSMTLNELEDDPETKLRVKRHKKRESASRRQLAQTAIDGDDDDDDNDGDDDGDEHVF